MIKLIEKSHINASVKPQLIKRLQEHHEIDMKGLESIIENLSLIEDPLKIKLEEIIEKTAGERYQNIK